MSEEAAEGMAVVLDDDLDVKARELAGSLIALAQPWGGTGIEDQRATFIILIAAALQRERGELIRKGQELAVAYGNCLIDLHAKETALRLAERCVEECAEWTERAEKAEARVKQLIDESNAEQEELVNTNLAMQRYEAEVKELREACSRWQNIAVGWATAANRAEQPPEFYKNYDEGTMNAMQALMTRARDKAQALREALEALKDAAEAYSADQSGADDPRCGLVQPITVAEGIALNEAMEKARKALEGKVWQH
jgi:hypothetical protein